MVCALRVRWVDAGVGRQQSLGTEGRCYLHPLWQHEIGPGHGGAASG